MTKEFAKSSSGTGLDDATEDVVVTLRDVRKSFGNQSILNSIDLDIHRGEFVALLGASGSGKTTLLRILAELDHANGGDVQVVRDRTVVFQEARLLPFRSVWRNVVLGVRGVKDKRALALKALDEVSLASKAQGWPKSLSGGEAQRVALARALVRSPELLLLDEPFASLDALTRLRMQDLVRKLWREHKPGVLLVTHDVDEAILLADRVLVLKEARFALDIDLADIRPREPGSHAFATMRRRLLHELGVDKREHDGGPA